MNIYQSPLQLSPLLHQGVTLCSEGERHAVSTCTLKRGDNLDDRKTVKKVNGVVGGGQCSSVIGVWR